MVNPVRSIIRWSCCLLTLAALVAFPCAGASPAAEDPPVDLPVSRAWSGDYPVAQLDRLPEGQRRSHVGYLGDREAFAAVWKAFKPGEELPDVDFGKNLVVFSRNVAFYNRVNILKVTLKEGVAEILSMETMSAMPVEEKVAMALAEIPREGVRFLKAGDERIPVSGNGAAADPRDATYTVDGRQVPLRNGRYETEAAPGSAVKAVTAVVGEPAVGDLEGDGDEDVAILLVHDPGGSGTFYYIAASINESGRYRGTEAVLLGDRISPGRIGIRNGVVVVEYTDRRPDEPMSALPSVGRSKVLALRDGRLAEIEPEGNCRSGLIVLDSPAPGARVSSPLVIRGRARGTWFFEGDFPVLLLDANGNVVARRFCTAKGEWMTKDFVPFEGTLTFEKPVSGGRGTLVLKKDNPTGLPEHDDALSVPLFFR